MGGGDAHPQTVGYKSRDIVLSPEHEHRAHNNRGIFQPIIAHDGLISGNWTPFKKDFQVEFFREGHNAEDVLSAWEEYARFREG